MVDSIRDTYRPSGDTTDSGFMASAQALLRELVRRLYLRRWLVGLPLLVIACFFVFWKLPGLPALAGSLAVLISAAMLPREDILPALRPRSRSGERITADDAIAGALEGLPSPVITLDTDRRVFAFNRLTTDLWPAIRQGDPISSFIRDPELLGAIARAHPGMRLQQLVPFEQRVPIERHMEARISWIGTRRSRPNSWAPAIMIHLRDLTERERIERLRTDFVANASHELRTPLTALIGFIETLQGAARDDQAAREHFLDIMARQASRMARLVDNLLSLSRIEMRMHLRPQGHVELTDIAQQVLSDLEPLREQTGVTFHFESEVGEAWVLGDRDELIQVVANLLENGVKYGREGGNVWLTLVRGRGSESGKLRVAVRDDGPGIAPEHLPRLTERFYRVNDKNGEKTGTGLGLAIVKHVVTRHRGDLKVDSDPGRGSVFTILLAEAAPPEA